MPAPAIVLNMFYTGLAIARTLSERDVPVIGLAAHRGIYGNVTRCARVRHAPDSKNEPEALFDYLLALQKECEPGTVVFPTRDHDLVFLDRYRCALEGHYSLVLPKHEVLRASLDKWGTYCWARRADIPSPRTWLISTSGELAHTLRELSFPCVLKPVEAHLWRAGDNWARVGGRKAFSVNTPEELLAEYEQLSHAAPRVLIQEMVPGTDENLFVAACYLDTNARPIASFTAQKLLQSPPLFGTGCLVQTVDRPDVAELAFRLLETMGYTGIAEVEFKWEAGSKTLKLIEINPRPWDQHYLGKEVGADLIYYAYCEHTGLEPPRPTSKPSGIYTWVAEDAFCMAVLRTLAKEPAHVPELLRLAKGRRVYAIWSKTDPRPFFFYMFRFLPSLAALGIRYIASVISGWASRVFHSNKGAYYDEHTRQTHPAD